MSTKKNINQSKTINCFKPLSIDRHNEIQTLEKEDQNAAFARYRELVKARKEREKLRPREPEIYHHNIYKK